MRIGVRHRRAGTLDRILTAKRAEVARMLAGLPTPAHSARHPKAGLIEALRRPRTEPSAKPPAKPSAASASERTPRGTTPSTITDGVVTEDAPNDRRRLPLRLITEIKLRSPSAGDLSHVLTPPQRALVYARGGATMISVLTDHRFFGGSFDDLAACREALDRELGDARPYLLCKEFVLHPIQIDRALHAGADAVLLIVRCLERGELPGLVRACEARDLLPLVEVTTEEELDRALEAGARAIGVNARDLNTLKMDAPRAAAVLAKIPDTAVAAHLSGLRGPDDVKQVADGRADAALIGEALMRQDDPAELLAAMRTAAG